MNVMNILRNWNVLYVDDDEASLKLGEALFSNYFRNVYVSSPIKVFEILKTHHIDLIITDIVMDNVSGFDLLKNIKEKYPSIIIIFFSAFFDTNTLLKSIENGVDGFLIKPFDESKFLSLLKKIIDRKNTTQDILNQYKNIVDDNLIVSKTDTKGIITYVNKCFEKISGFKKEELIGRPHNIVRHPDMKKEVFKEMWDTIKSGKVWRGLIKNRRKDGNAYYVDSVIQPIFDENGEIKEYIALRKDVTNFMTAEKLINDKLQIIKEAMLIVVNILNIEDMKLILEEDIILKYKIRLTKMIRRYLLKYFSDVETYDISFENVGFLITDYKKSVDNVLEITENIMKKVMNKVLIVEGLEFFPLIKVSIAYGDENIYTKAMLGIEKLKKSEDLIIIANGLYKNIKKQVIENMNFLKTLEKALKNNQIISFFQPIYDNKSKKVVKFESLVRIVDEEGRIIPPYFLEISKKVGLYGNVSFQVLENCFEMYLKYRFPISINLAPNDILRDFIKNKIISFLKSANIKKGDITFELLEDEIIKYPEIMHNFIEEVTSLGASVAIDDFGSGYSNFERVVSMNVELLKIDGSLIKDIHKDIKKQHIVEALVLFAKKENIKIVAEFVENEEIFNKVKELGVDYSQGYYFSPPISPENVGNFLDL